MKLIKFILLMIASFIICSILHNVFYAVAIYFEDYAVIRGIADILDVAFFLIAIPVIPIVMIVGAIKIIIDARKKE